MKYRWITPAAAILLAACASNPLAAGFTERDDVRAFIADMSKRHGFDRAQLEKWFEETHPRPEIIETITRPAESKPWYEYRPIFLQPARINGGVDFWKENAEALRHAEEVYGVPPQIIAAILGVETRYGRSQGEYPVMDALATLAFDYPPRGKFFQGELEQYLLMARDEKLDPLAVRGSYAGAMGQSQFIPSSYRRFAVDFDADGKRDIWADPADAIGSVANYLKENGWERGGVVAVPATIDIEKMTTTLTVGVKPTMRVAEFKAQGVSINADLPNKEMAALVALDQRTGPEYWLGLQNFYVITRYNRSPLYAMAVFQLSEEIRALYNNGKAP